MIDIDFNKVDLAFPKVLAKKLNLLKEAMTDVIDDENVSSSTTYSSEKIVELVNRFGFSIQVVDELPSRGRKNTIYLVPASDEVHEYNYLINTDNNIVYYGNTAPTPNPEYQIGDIIKPTIENPTSAGLCVVISSVGPDFCDGEDGDGFEDVTGTITWQKDHYYEITDIVEFKGAVTGDTLGKAFIFEEYDGTPASFVECEELPGCFLYKQEPSQDIKDEYIWVNNQWEKIGSTAVDLSQYYTKTETDALLTDYFKKEIVVDELPISGQEHTLYLVPKELYKYKSCCWNDGFIQWGTDLENPQNLNRNLKIGDKILVDYGRDPYMDIQIPQLLTVSPDTEHGFDKVVYYGEEGILEHTCEEETYDDTVYIINGITDIWNVNGRTGEIDEYIGKVYTYTMHDDPSDYDFEFKTLPTVGYVNESGDTNYYDEYLWINGRWELVGSNGGGGTSYEAGTNITIEDNVISSEQISNIEELPDASKNRNRIFRRDSDKKVFIAKQIRYEELDPTNKKPDDEQVDVACLFDFNGMPSYYKGIYTINCSDGVLHWYVWEGSPEGKWITEENAANTALTTNVNLVNSEYGWSDITSTSATFEGTKAQMISDCVPIQNSGLKLIQAVYNAPEANQIGNAVLVDDHTTMPHIYTGEQTTITIEGHNIVVYKWQNIEDPNDYVATNKKASEIYYTGSYPNLTTDIKLYDLNVTPVEYDEIYELYIPHLNAADEIQVGAASIQHMDFDQLYEYLGEGDYIDSEGEHKILYGWRDEDGYYFCTVKPAEEIYGTISDNGESITGIVANLEIYNLSDAVHDNEDGTYTLDEEWSHIVPETMMFYLHNFVPYTRPNVIDEWEWVEIPGDFNYLMEAEPLCFTAEQANSTIAFSIGNAFFQYSFDKTTWENWDKSAITLENVGDKVYLRGINNGFGTVSSPDLYFGQSFVMTGRISASGDVMSLLEWRYLLTTLPYAAFVQLFKNCTALTKAPEMNAKTVSQYSCLEMYYGCTNLVEVPDLPATTLSDYCYDCMFYNCTGLTTAPKLPATTLANSCYISMFYNCSSLIKAPELLATELPRRCYYQMFTRCTSLNYIKCIAKPFDSSTYPTSNWTYNVNSTGVFIKDASTEWTRGAMGIPTNWTVVNYYDDIDLDNKLTSKQDEIITTPNEVIDILNTPDHTILHLTDDSEAEIIANNGVLTSALLSSYSSTAQSAVLGDDVTEIGTSAFNQFSELESVNIPSTVTNIQRGAFNQCSSLENIVIPDSVIELNESAFMSCASLETAILSNNIKSIGESAFYNCNHMTSVNIPNKITSIGSSAFYQCSSLTTIVIPSTIKTISSEAFYKCTGLTSITVEAITPPNIYSRCFDNTNDCTIFVPADSVSTYQTQWSQYSSRIQAIQ